MVGSNINAPPSASKGLNFYCLNIHDFRGHFSTYFLLQVSAVGMFARWRERKMLREREGDRPNVENM